MPRPRLTSQHVAYQLWETENPGLSLWPIDNTLRRITNRVFIVGYYTDTILYASILSLCIVFMAVVFFREGRTQPAFQLAVIYPLPLDGTVVTWIYKSAASYY